METSERRRPTYVPPTPSTPASTRTEETSDSTPGRSGSFTPPAISLPRGGGAIRGIGEKFAANPVTGSGSMTVRSQVLIQKALELCAEVRGLGQTLLSTIEKRDGERMALLRQEHEVRILQLTQEVRFLQWKQTQEATDALQRSRKAALERYR